MSYTYDDFVMESAMVETTNETTVSDITMEQWKAEFNVACAAFDAYNKYSVISEYATCDLEEYFQESKYGPSASAKLTGTIAKVDQWGKEGGTLKKVASTVAVAALKFIRAIARFFSKLFGGAKSVIDSIATKLKAIRDKHRNPKKAEAKEAKAAAKQMKDSDYLAQGEQKRADAYAAGLEETSNKLSEAEKKIVEQSEKIASYVSYVEKLNTKIAEQNKILEAIKSANDSEVNGLLDRLHKVQDQVAEYENILKNPGKYMTYQKAMKALKTGDASKIDDKSWDVMVSYVVKAKEPMKEMADNLKKSEVLMDDISTNSKNEKAVVETSKATKSVAQIGAEVMKTLGFVQNDQGVFDVAATK